MRFKRHLLANDRGAVFLLAIYFSALILLLVGGVSLQRTNTEVRAAQLSRDMQQAFWYSEAALDSYLTRAGTETFNSTQPYPVNGMPDNSAFRPSTIDAQIIATPAAASTMEEVLINGKLNLKNYSQRLVTKITGTGNVSAIERKSSLHVEESGPLRGIWANKTIAVSAGRNVALLDTVLYGDLHSQLGAVLSKIEGNKLKFEGLIKTTGSEDTWAEKLDYWKSSASNDLLSIKNGYMLVQGVVEDPAEVAGSYSAVHFSSGSDTTAIANVSGNLSVGLTNHTDPGTETAFNSCSGTLNIASASVTIDDNMYCGMPGRSDPGISCTGGIIGDLDYDPDTITLCVNAIVPATPQLWLDTLAYDRAPAIRFTKPTKIVVTGSALIKTEGLSVNLGGTFWPVNLFADPALLITHPSLYVQNNWNVSIGARLQAQQSRVDTTPAPILISKQKFDPAVLSKYSAAFQASHTHPPGMFFIKPGDNFQGSIIAPDSLVVVRSRSCAANDSCTDPLKIQYLVGDEVAIELEGDQLHIGEIGQDDQSATTAQVKAWTAR